MAALEEETEVEKPKVSVGMAPTVMPTGWMSVLTAREPEAPVDMVPAVVLLKGRMPSVSLAGGSDDGEPLYCTRYSNLPRQRFLS